MAPQPSTSLRWILITLSFALAASCTDDELAHADTCAFWQGKNVDPIERILIIGNSITYRPADSTLGWYGNWGMAASIQSRDYVHILKDSLREHAPAVMLETVSGVAFEREYPQFDADSYYEGQYKDYDLIIVRLGENVRLEKNLLNSHC